VGGPPDPATLERPWLASYPPGVPPTYRFPSVPVTRFLDDAARDFADTAGLTVGRDTLDHATVRTHVDRLAAALRERGIAPGDRVLVAVPASPIDPIALLAIWRLGAIAVPVGPALRPDRLAAIARDADPAAVIGTASAVRHLADHALTPPLAIVAEPDGWPRRPGRLASLARRRPRRAQRDGTAVSLDAVIAEVAVGAVPPPPAADAPALLAYRPRSHELRGVVLTHANLVASAFQARLWIPDVQAGRERVLLADGLHDVTTLLVGYLPALLSGAAAILLDDPDPAVLARAVERESPTLLMTTPRRIAALLAEGDAAKRDLTSLRVVLAGGAPLDPNVAADLEGRTGGARVRELFGLAEAGAFTHGQPVYGRTAPGTAGLPVTSTVAAVVDPDDLGALCPPDTPGRLLVHGPQVAAGYWRREAATEASFVAGWVVTDDLASVSEDGVFTHVGRRDAVVQRDGHLVSLRRIEQVLERHAGVERAGVVASEDGEVLLAAVVLLRRRPRPSADDLVVHCHAHLDPRAVPDRVTLVDELPEDDAGELARDDLRRDLVGR
jgi:long-chain acyl-CoA synthetase